MSTWDELALRRWGPAIGDPTPGIIIDGPARGRIVIVGDPEERDAVQGGQAHESPPSPRPRSTHVAIRGRPRGRRPAAGSGPRQSAGPTPHGSTELATPPPWNAREAARGDDKPQGGSVRAQGSALLPMSKLARPRRELGGRSNHVDMPDLRGETEHSGPSGRNRRCRVELTTSVRLVYRFPIYGGCTRS